MKRLELIFYRQNHLRPDWYVDVTSPEVSRFLAELFDELRPCGITLDITHTDRFTIDIRSYHDLLNAVRVSSPADNLANVCIGHLIGKSERLDLMEDIRKGVRRVAFAPETIQPDDQNRRVCHNCGCGC
ncbi:MAG: hypothetical protein Fur0034_10760 [Desulfuromonadia bacterium]